MILDADATTFRPPNGRDHADKSGLIFPACESRARSWPSMHMENWGDRLRDAQTKRVRLYWATFPKACLPSTRSGTCCSKAASCRNSSSKVSARMLEYMGEEPALWPLPTPRVHGVTNSMNSTGRPEILSGYQATVASAIFGLQSDREAMAEYLKAIPSNSRLKT